MCPRCCISFESYIKPQPELRDRQAKHVVYLLNPTSNHNVRYQQSILIALYIFWLLHQTTTSRQTISNYIGCISFDSYIKPQLTEPFLCLFTVVYLLTPTSNHNIQSINNSLYLLYIFWLLHQTTTVALCSITMPSCISFDSYIKPQPLLGAGANGGGCISFDSYIKPQQSGSPIALSWSCISFDSYIKPQRIPEQRIWCSVVYLLTPTSNHNLSHRFTEWASVVYLLTPTSNHNIDLAYTGMHLLYIFWLLHQTTTY